MVAVQFRGQLSWRGVDSLVGRRRGDATLAAARVRGKSDRMAERRKDSLTPKERVLERPHTPRRREQVPGGVRRGAERADIGNHGGKRTDTGGKDAKHADAEDKASDVSGSGDERHRFTRGMAIARERAIRGAMKGRVADFTENVSRGSAEFKRRCDEGPGKVAPMEVTFVRRRSC